MLANRNLQYPNQHIPRIEAYPYHLFSDFTLTYFFRVKTREVRDCVLREKASCISTGSTRKLTGR